MFEAEFYTKLNNNAVRCELCPWFCELKPGQTGNCKVRKNENGILTSLVFNCISALALDPIEKKPLFHFLPGAQILSVGSVGCNLHCSFCQNHHISQCSAENFSNFREITSEQLTETAAGLTGNKGIAYTYNEPFTFYEFMFETAKQASEKGLKNVVVSNGYVNPEPLKKILPFIDAFNIDLKAFTEDFYSKQTKGRLEPVLKTLKTIADSGTHLEITNLVIPGLNDDKTVFKKMAEWIAFEIGPQVPLHLSRYYPKYKQIVPATPTETMNQCFDISKKMLNHVYLGNVYDPVRTTTFCSNCGETLIVRNGFSVNIQNTDKNGNCKNCGKSANLILN